MKAPVLVVLLLGVTLSGCFGGEDTRHEDDAPDMAPGLVSVDPNEAPLPLAPGDYSFWDLPRITDSFQSDPSMGAADFVMGETRTNEVNDPREDCESGDVTCVEYLIEVAPGGDRLRVALDTNGSQYRLGLYDPGGGLVAQTGRPVDHQRDARFSLEVFAVEPVVGAWTALAVATVVGDDQARMRAKLEAPSTPETGAVVATLPNLRPIAPMDFHLAPYDGSGPMASCQEDEIIEDGAERCLRFSFGYGNVGDGAFEVLFTPVEEGPLGVSTGEIMQRVHFSDGSTELREAGTYEYHATHGHYHYQGILDADLLRVTDAESGELEPMVKGAKRGACAHDWRIAHWKAFIAEPHGTHGSGDDCDIRPGRTSPTGARIGLTRGWTDLYDWNLPDNYVEASDITDGRYVLRTTIDAEGNIDETNETDNVAYALIDVTGDQVELIERGLGTDPWDEDKVVTQEWVP